MNPLLDSHSNAAQRETRGESKRVSEREIKDHFWLVVVDDAEPGDVKPVVEVDACMSFSASVTITTGGARFVLEVASKLKHCSRCPE